MSQVDGENASVAVGTDDGEKPYKFLGWVGRLTMGAWNGTPFQLGNGAPVGAEDLVEFRCL